MNKTIYCVSTILKAHVATLTEQHDVDQIQEALDGYIAQLVPYNNKATHSDVRRRELHMLADEFVRDEILTDGKPEHITCQKGCSHCCKQLVMVTKPEAERLLILAIEQGIALDQAQLKRQSLADDTGWLQLEIEDRQCPFLGPDNLCQVYDDRPLACRKYFVVSDPDLCNITRYPSGQVRVCYSVNAEVLTTAAFTALDSCSMPQALLTEMNIK